MEAINWTGQRPEAQGERSASLEERPAGLEARSRRPKQLIADG